MDYVNIDIVRRAYVNDSVYDETLLEKYQVWNNHFLRIDKQFWSQDQPGAVNAVVISAYDRGNILLAQEDWGLDDYAGLANGPSYEKGCYWQCNGPNYAYRIQQFMNVSNPLMGHYAIQPAYDYYNEEVGLQIPFYMHMAQAELNMYTYNFENFPYGGWYDDNWIQNGLSDPWIPLTVVMIPQFHGMGSEWSEIGELGEYDKGIHGFYQYTNPMATGGYTSPSGAGLNDEYIYAIKKYTGWWRTGSFRLPAPGDGPVLNSMQITGDCVNNDLTFMIQQMNSSASNLQFYKDQNSYNNDPDDQYAPYHPNYLPDFKCEGGLQSSSLSSSVEGNLDCFYSEWYLNWVIDQIEDGPDYNYWAEILGITLDCFDGETGGSGGNGGSTGGGVLMDDVLLALEYVSMTKVESIGAQKIFDLNPAQDLFDSTGVYTPQGPDYIEPGLYTLAFKYPDHPITKIIFENKKRLQNVIPLSSFVQATVFPVPIVDDYSFNIHLVTTAKSRFRYKLFDFNGNELHNQVVQLPKNHDNNHLVTISNAMPDGLLLHKFIFEDGSNFTITTIK